MKKKYNINLTPELSYTIGVLLGDGSNEKIWGKLKFAVKDYDFIIKIKNNLEKQFKKQLHIKKITNNHFKKNSYLYYIEICSKFISHNIESKIKKIKKSKTKKIISNFLAGCYDSEGHVDKDRPRIRLSVRNYNYIQLIHNSLNKLKIIHTLKKIKNQNKTYFIIRIYSRNILRFNKYIQFSIKRKQDRIDNLINSYKF